MNAKPMTKPTVPAADSGFPGARRVCSLVKHGLAVLIAFAAGILPTTADSLYGSITFKDKSKDKGTTAITTSWNSAKGKSDGNGMYKIDFGGKVGKRVTVYVNGKRYSEALVKGDTELDIVVRD